MVKKSKLNLPAQLSNDLSYLTGVFAGDGSINFRQKKSEYLLKCVGNPKDEKMFYYEVISPLFQSLFHYQLKLKYFDSNTTFGFIIYSKDLVNYLTTYLELPLGKKYGSLKIPSLILNDNTLTKSFIKGVFDTDGCITFKKRYKKYNYYPVISFSSKSKNFVKEISVFLRQLGFKIVEIYDYHVLDSRISCGYTIINRIELNGRYNLDLWIKEIGFLSPKHNLKIERYYIKKN